MKSDRVPKLYIIFRKNFIKWWTHNFVTPVTDHRPQSEHIGKEDKNDRKSSYWSMMQVARKRC
jgi:hypothetical protein